MKQDYPIFAALLRMKKRMSFRAVSNFLWVAVWSICCLTATFARPVFGKH